MRLTAISSTALLVAILAPAVFGQTSTRKGFEELCQIMQGRWVGDVTLIEDWPGLGSKGEKITAYGEIKIVADGNALEGVWYGGKGWAKWITVYDAGSEQIRELVASSGGYMWQTVTAKKDGKWTQTRCGSMPDGKKIEGVSTLTISDGGDTHTWTGWQTVDGKKSLDLHDVYTRVAK